MQQLDSLIKFFEGLNPDLLVLLGGVYADNASFTDPFNEVRGLERIRDIYLYRFNTYKAPRIKFRQRFTGTDGTALLWDFSFQHAGATRSISGATHLRQASDGRIHYQRDYWDATEALYVRMPGIGAVMRFAKRQASLAA